MKKDRRDPSGSPVKGGGKEHRKKGPSPSLPVEGGGKEHRKNWKEYTATVEDIQNFLMDRIMLRHNVVTGRVESLTPDPSQPHPYPLSEWRGGLDGGGGCWVPINDRIVNSLWAEMSQGEKVVRAQDVYRVIDSDFVPSYNPFTYYLDHLPPWDGEDHILGMSVSVCVKGGVDEQMLFAEYVKKWLVGMVAGWIDPSVVNNVILVLIGEQGSYKTTWFARLLPPELQGYFRIKTNSSRMTKDDLLVLSEYGLVCYEELDTMRPSELNQLKAAVTMPSVDERRPYGHFTEHRRHIASFCGTGNNIQFLSDPTGNRRWLPFEVESIDPPQDHPLDYDRIYSQAYTLYREGFQYWFSKAEIERLAAHNRQFETPRLEAELVQQYFRKPVGEEPGEFVPVSLALQIVGANITQKLSTVSLGRAFVEQGFKRKTFRNVRGYVVVRRSAEEMRSIRQAMAAAPAHTDTDITDVF